ncbi:Uncharacterised protein [Mycobacteroides abscessus subsp. abscessus]|nr:Uncharacterised protein [Mycobacteroides abscessus subsp. abscessus]
MFQGRGQMRSRLAHKDLIGLDPLRVTAVPRLQVIGNHHRSERQHGGCFIPHKQHDGPQAVIGEVAVDIECRGRAGLTVAIHDQRVHARPAHQLARQPPPAITLGQ